MTRVVCSVVLVCISFATVFIVTTCHAEPYFPQADSIPPASVPVDQWLNGPDRQDFPWKVRVARQSLTFQQRHLVQILVTIQARDLFKAVPTRDLHFVIKIADRHGIWLDGQSYSHFVPPKDFSGKDLLQPTTNLYVQPGNYTIAVLAYDALHENGNVWRTRLFVPNVNGPLPDLGRDFPVVEFLPAYDPPPELKTSTAWALNSPAALSPSMLDPLALGHGRAHLPVANKHPVRIDVVVNLSPGPKTSIPYKYGEGLVLQVGNLLSQLAPEKGCLRFTAIDTLRQDVIVDRVDSHKVDWDVISKKIASVELNVIDVKALKEAETALWFKQTIERITDDSASCGSEDGIPRNVLVVVSMPFTFPPAAHAKPIKALLPRPRSYHMEIMFRGVNWDEIGNVLKPLQPTRLTFADALALRQKLAFLIADITNSSE